MGAIESFFPIPVSLIDTDDDETDNNEDNNDENDTKNRNLSGGSTDNLNQDFKTFKKYLKIEIKKELSANNAAVVYNDSEDDLEEIKKQVLPKKGE